MRRAQSSMEYLVTYGWALLAILVTIGALAAFGYLDVNRYLPARCEIGAQFVCTDYAVYTAVSSINNGYVELQLENGFGETINITNIWFRPKTAGTVQLLPGLSAIPASGIRVTPGNTTMLRATIPLGSPHLLSRGERMSVPISITFRRDTPGSSLHNATGVVFATVQ